MNFQIKKAREQAGYSQKELAEIIGVAPNTFHGYESGKHDPKSDLLIKIAKACNVTTDFLLGNNHNPYHVSENKQSLNLTNSETEHIKKYRALDEHGKEVVDVVLEKETARMKKEQAAPMQYTEHDKIIKLPDPIQAASAGFGEYIDDESSQWVAVKYNDITKKADYIMRVAGDSMEPKIHDGDRVLVRQQPAVDIGEMGIFVKEDERFIKIYCGDRLKSVNPDYPDVPLEEYSCCVGKVLGVLEKDWIVE